MASVAVIDGFAEGPRTTRLFREALKKAGYDIAEEPAQADVIFAHSGACYYLPDTRKDQLVFLVGPPYWPGKPIVLSLLQKLMRDFTYRKREGRLGYWARKHLASTLYIATDIPHTIQLALFARNHDFHKKLRNTQFVLIRNHDDSFCMPDVEHIPFGNKKIDYYAMPGEHDDIWVNPAPYIALIPKHLANS